MEANKPRMPPEFGEADASVHWWNERPVFVIFSMQATQITR